jgi:hypothetical protein
VLGLKADLSKRARERVSRTARNDVPHAQTRIAGPALTVSKGKGKVTKLAPGEGRITRETIVTIAAPFQDRRWVPDVVPRVVDSSECRDWAKAAG